MSQTIIVTGASRGLGAAGARIAARLGARLVLNARSAGDLEAVAAQIRAAGGQAVAVAGDVTQPQICQDLVATALASYGRLDAVVNSAGVLDPMARVADSDPSLWTRNLMVNLVGPYLLLRAALPHLREVNGRVVNVSSGLAVRAMAGVSVYCAGKAALNHFTAVLALEEPAVTCLAFRPGVVDTAMQAHIRRAGRQGMDEADYQRFVRRHDQGELLPPEQPGRALAVLALGAPPAWSGQFIHWNEDRVQELVQRYA